MSYETILDLTEKDKRFIAACHAMQGMLAGGWNVMELGVVQHALTMADALLAELERK